MNNTMLGLIFSLGLCMGPMVQAAPTSPVQKTVLKRLGPGRYRCIVVGVWCNACTRAIVEELKAIPGIREVSFDFEEGFLWLRVDKGYSIRVGKIERALRLASRRVNLGVHFSLSEIQPAL